ncbi:MAG: L-serine ammonia-lyase, iron-sulfur-dependent, subunit beta [Tepidanaerobacter acetatoxydans]|uniref:L-serine ammonia-lyase, iron-sulfur-dependent subunit beta n=1 Tax=Tepidanaerobacter acetatoxydans TaxID=499229 RepID=UPI0026F14A8C|nr:L-serine ammonia-lyase, iron-sulfur-dependent subunit beta [Tepidanaerobacter acetatoxydans]NLU11064.1 L-serine ammonia-lyase, iron-sulfur-dependent, subunit beta [Tepidanaerobacter acetatoxydans]
MNIFDIIGPVMIGPSSSHTAGAVRMGNLAKNILGEEPTEAQIVLFNSFSKTGKGHGTDKALVAGILGLSTDDDGIKESFEIAQKKGIEVDLVFGNTHPEFPPNTAKFTLKGKNNSTVVIGSSVGGGRVIIFAINGFSTEFSGEFNTIITIHDDRPGVIARVASFLAEKSINIAQMKVSRESRGKTALMVIEVDEEIPEGLESALSNINHVQRAMIIKSVLGGV